MDGWMDGYQTGWRAFGLDGWRNIKQFRDRRLNVLGETKQAIGGS